MPGLPSGRSMTGRMSPSMMKVESVKSSSIPALMKSMGLKSSSGQKMVLKSNAAMAADLPKSIPRTTLKKDSMDRSVKKKPA